MNIVPHIPQTARYTIGTRIENKFLISTSWEAKCISHKQYEDIAVNLDDVGKMLWVWKKSLDQRRKTALGKRGKD
ncbi:hypothetical protein HGB07_03035 [Candidatus Roizmanbacteria bacterium]|nr:hypothetical protein [Candidatus Roizmanbacteria bacterium]